LPVPADIDPDVPMEFNLPKGPSIAVLPFVNMSKDPEQEYFCDGMTENIIATLAQTKLLFVIARNSTFAYKNKSVKVQQIGKELSADYVIEGSIQKIDKIIRIVIQLVDTDTGLHIWSERYDREFKNLFKLQDEITLEILKNVGIKLIAPWDKSPVKEEEFTDANSFIKLGKHIEFMRNPKKEEYASALKNAQEILVSNPELNYRYNILGWVYMFGALFDYCESRAACLLKATEEVKNTLSLDESNSLAHRCMGWLFLIRKEHDNAIASFKKSIELNSMAADSYHSLGLAFNLVGRPEEALESLKIAFRLNPFPYIYYSHSLAYSYLLLEEYEKAINILNNCLERQPDFGDTYLLLAITYGYSGQEENAKQIVKQLLNIMPYYSIEMYKKTTLTKNSARIERAIKTLRKAGVPETAE